MTRLAALLSLVACAHAPVEPDWIVTRTCTPLYPFPAIMQPHYCSDLALPFAACIYTTDETGLHCDWQVERATCDGEWDLIAHRCRTWTPDEAAAWEVTGTSESYSP